MNTAVKNTLLAFIAIVVIAGGVLLFGRAVSDEDTWLCDNGTWVKHGNPTAAQPTEPCEGVVLVSSFQECVDAGNPIMEIYPRQCRSGDQTFTEDIGNELEKQDLISVMSPRPNNVIQTPLTIVGEARGPWFFEGSFMITLTDTDGTQLGSTNAHARSEWMTEDFVIFDAELEFTAPSGTTGTLLFEKSNPSGLAENDDSLTMPVNFE